MIAYRGNALWVVGDDGVLRRRIGENVPWLQRGGINGNLRPSGALYSISIGGKGEFEGEVVGKFLDVGNLWNRNDIELTILETA